MHYETWHSNIVLDTGKNKSKIINSWYLYMFNHIVYSTKNMLQIKLIGKIRISHCQYYVL